MNKRFLIAVVSLRLCIAVAATPETPWFDRALVGMEIGPTGAQFGYSDTNGLIEDAPQYQASVVVAGTTRAPDA